MSLNNCKKDGFSSGDGTCAKVKNTCLNSEQCAKCVPKEEMNKDNIEQICSTYTECKKIENICKTNHKNYCENEYEKCIPTSEDECAHNLDNCDKDWECCNSGRGLHLYCTDSYIRGEKRCQAF